MDPQVKAMHDAHLRELADRKNTTVFTVKHDVEHEPWESRRLRGVMESLTARVLAFDDAVDDFTVRKTCIDDAETLAFQRDHPKFYWMLTDRKVMRDERARNAVTGLLFVHEQVESGVVAGEEANASATKTVLAALQQE